VNLNQLKNLIKIANKLDRVGETREATKLDSVIKKISEDMFGESYPDFEDLEYGQDFEEPQHSSDLVEFSEFNTSLGDAYRKYNGLRADSWYHPDNMFDLQNPMSKFDPGASLISQWDNLMEARSTNRAVEVFLNKLHKAWWDLKYGKYGESLLEEGYSETFPEALDNAKLKPSVSDLAGDPNIRTIQDILGINASGEWDQETKFAVRKFLDRNQSLLYHEDYPAEKYAVSIMMYGPMGFRVRNSDQPEITGNSYGDWASLISALDESYRRESSMLEELGSRASMNNLFSGLSSYKGFVRR